VGEKNPVGGGGITLLKGGGRDTTEGGGGVGGSQAMRGGARGGGPGSHRWGTARAVRHDRQQPGRGVHVRTMACDTGSLMSGSWMAAGGHGERGAGKEMEWAEPV
jgi:hypothetical protein